MREFEFIQRFCLQLGAVDPAVVVGVGDDAAVTQLPAGHQLLVSTDSMNVNQHFYADAKPEDLAHKLLHSNVSDIAAMGGRPRWATLALSFEELQPQWLQAFAEALDAQAQALDLAVIGGDTTKGAMSLTLTVMGTIEQGKALLRTGAKVNDLVCVTGTLGGAAAGLTLTQAERSNEPTPSAFKHLEQAEREALIACLTRPNAQLAIGQSLVGFASSCIDISDGLAGDLQHILRASQRSAVIDWSAIPVHPALQSIEHLDHNAVKAWVLYGGEDYELAFTIAPDAYSAWQTSYPALANKVSVIGLVRDLNDQPRPADECLLWMQDADAHYGLSAYAYEHF